MAEQLLTDYLAFRIPRRAGDLLSVRNTISKGDKVSMRRDKVIGAISYSAHDRKSSNRTCPFMRLYPFKGAFRCALYRPISA